MQRFNNVLIPHGGGAAPPGVRGLAANVERAASGPSLRFIYRLTGELAGLAIPRRGSARRAERLWEHTCFEAFVAPGSGERYYELNFSPSTEWAAYELDGYRQGLRPLALARPPSIAVAESANELRVTADVELDALVEAPWPWRIGLTAVVEDRAGGHAYFALAHPRQHADFHDAAGFVISLDGSAR
jgi:hypothetical protein